MITLVKDTIDNNDIDRLVDWLKTYPRLSKGHVTLEFSNTTPLPAKIYANEGVAQFVFIKGNEDPAISYADRNGKYQGQKGVTLPKI